MSLSLCGFIVRVTVVPKRTAGGDIDPMTFWSMFTTNNPSWDYSHPDDQTTEMIINVVIIIIIIIIIMYYYHYYYLFSSGYSHADIYPMGMERVNK